MPFQQHVELKPVCNFEEGVCVNYGGDGFILFELSMYDQHVQFSGLSALLYTRCVNVFIKKKLRKIYMGIQAELFFFVLVV